MSEVREYFARLYKKYFNLRPILDNITVRILDEISRLDLERCFSSDEFLEGLRAYKKDKTPGLDRFNMGFLLEFWNVIKSDLIDLFWEFYERETFVKSLNSIFIILIAKVGGATNIKEFRPISLMCVYKLIAKVLIGRMAKVLVKIIGES